MQRSKLSIVIPCYNQTAYLRGLLESLKEQTFREFDIIIVDDNSSEDYPSLLKDFEDDFTLVYQRNEKNLGAIRNMFHCIAYPVSTEYVMCIHEDDFLHNDYLRIAIDKLDRNPQAAFAVSGAVTFFGEEDYRRKKAAPLDAVKLRQSNAYERQEFIEEVFFGRPLVFGSAIYRTAAVAGHQPDLERYSVLCDRPFLAGILGPGRQAIWLEERFVYYRDHGFKDGRGDGIEIAHMFNLFTFYRDSLSLAPGKKQEIFYRNATNNLLYAYTRLKDKELGLLGFWRQGQELGLFRFSAIRALGIFALLSMLIGKRLTYAIIFLRNKLK